MYNVHGMYAGRVFILLAVHGYDQDVLQRAGLFKCKLQNSFKLDIIDTAPFYLSCTLGQFVN